MQKFIAKISLIFFFSVLALGLIAQDAQDEAIKKVVLDETNSYFKKDSALWESTWLKDPKTSRIFIGMAVFFRITGWDSIASENARSFRAHPKPDSVELTTDSFVIRKDGKLAVAEYKQTLKFLSSPPPFDVSVTHEQRTLVKQGGKWKIASQTSNELSAFGKHGTELTINQLGYMLMQDGKNEEAIKVLEMNTKMYPDSFNTFDSLGEAYAKAGNKELAIQNYQKSLELNPNNSSGKKALEKLK